MYRSGSASTLNVAYALSLPLQCAYVTPFVTSSPYAPRCLATNSNVTACPAVTVPVQVISSPSSTAPPGCPPGTHPTNSTSDGSASVNTTPSASPSPPLLSTTLYVTSL